MHSTHFRFFTHLVGVARLVGSGCRAWLKRLGSLNLLFLIIGILVVNLIVKVLVFVTKFAAAFHHSNVFQAVIF